MTTIGVFSLGGAPGVTTTVCALAATWPSTGSDSRSVGPVLVEAAAAGGELAAWWGLAAQPGLVTLASQPCPDAQAFRRHTQVSASGVLVCPAPPGGLQATAALGALADAGLPDPGIPMLVDLGRLDAAQPDAAGWRLAAAMDRVIAVTRPVTGQIAHLAAAGPWLLERLPGVGLVLVGDGDSRPGEVAKATGLRVAGRIPDDPRSARRIAAQARPRRAGRSRLLSAASRLATRLHDAPTTSPAAGTRVAELGGELS